MKKFFVILAVALLSISASAQVQFGAKVGFDLTNFWGKDVKHGMRPNFQAGVLMEYKASKSFGIAPEIVFASQGGRSKENGVTQKSTVNYINIPVMLKFYPSENFSIDFGPQLGINVYSKFTTDVSGTSVTENWKDYTKGVDFGLGLGVTYDLTENAFIQARYTMGLTKVYKTMPILGDIDAKNGNVQIAFGWMF